MVTDDPIFDTAMVIVLQHEGGYVNDPFDRGGETNFGISKRAYPDLDIAALTADEAKEIYRRDYWIKYHINQLPVLAPKVLDTAVLIGPVTAIRMLQNALAGLGLILDCDGIIGGATIKGCGMVPTPDLLVKYRSLLSAHFRQIVASRPEDAKFLNGWLTRAVS